MALSDIVNVSISRESRATTSDGFGTLLIVGPNVNVGSRVSYYTELADVATALCGGTTSPEYAAASVAFSSTPRVARVALGHILGTKTITDNAGTWTSGGSIVSIVNGTTVTTAFTTDKNTSLTTHAAAIEALTSVTTATYNSGAHTIVITPVAGTVIGVVTSLVSITGTMTVTVSATGTEAIDTALGNINDSDNAWYGVCMTDRTKANQILAAAWVEANKKLIGFGDYSSACVDSTTAADDGTDEGADSIGAILKARSYARSFVVYNAESATKYPEASLFGKILALDPGSYTAKFKSLPGITVDTLTPTQQANARGKNVNTYMLVGGANILENGTVAEGEWIDTIVFIDWLESNMITDVYGTIRKGAKLPYTSAGIAAIKSTVDKRLQIGQNRGGISPTEYDEDGIQIGGYITTVPALGDVVAADKANRVLRDVKFTAWLAGAIHSTVITGNVIA